MALSDLAVYSDWVRETLTETLQQQIDLFNGATNNCITMSLASNPGDYSDDIFWGRVSGLVKRRNAYGSGAVTAKTLTQLVETMVKIASGTPPINLDPGMFKWIGSSPEEAGASLAKQLAPDILADMLNTSLTAGVAALENVAAVKYDATGNTAPADKMTFDKFNTGQALLGDAASSIECWVMHSKPLFDLYNTALTGTGNNPYLFSYGTINVTRDPFGRPMIMSDSPGLVTIGTPNVYHILGLQRGAIQVQQNDNEYTDNVQTLNGNENILRTYQAEWTWELGLKGFTWNKSAGGHSPTDAAIDLATNWTQIVTSIKNLMGVVIKVH